LRVSLINKILADLLPVSLGGNSTDSVRDYVRNRIIVSSKVDKIGFRIQKFNIATLDGDDDSVLLTSLLTSNLIEGSRAEIWNNELVLGKSGSYSAYSKVFSKRVRYEANGKFSNILSIGERRISYIDMTDYFNFINKYSSSLSKNERLSLNLMFYNFRRNLPPEMKLKIDGKRYEPQTSESSFCPESIQFRTDIRPVLDSKFKTTRLDIIGRKKDKYTHNITIYDDEHFEVDDTKFDKHLIKRISGNGLFKYEVDIVDRYKLLTVMITSDDNETTEKDMILTVLGQVETPNPNKVILRKKKNSVMFNFEDKMRVLTLLKGYEDKELFTTNLISKNQLLDETISKSPELAELNFRMAGEDTSNFFQEDNMSDGMFDEIISGLKGPTPVSEDDSESGEYSDLDSESESNGEVSVSSTLIKSNASSHYKNFVSFDGNEYTLRLTMGLEEVYETDPDGKTAVEKLIDDVDRLDDFERFWCLSLISVMFSDIKVIKYTITSILYMSVIS